MSIHVSNALGEFDFEATMAEVGGGTEVEANPEIIGDEQDLTSIGIDETKYKIDTGTEVVANPTLAGTESSLTGLQVGDTKYKNDYLPLSGGTVTGNIAFSSTNYGIQDNKGNDLLRGASTIQVGSSSKPININTPAGSNITHNGSIVILDTLNTQANPTLAGTEPVLNGLKVNNDKFAMPAEVVANPTLAGTEAELTAIQIGNIKYKLPSGGNQPQLFAPIVSGTTNKITSVTNDTRNGGFSVTITNTIDDVPVQMPLTITQEMDGKVLVSTASATDFADGVTSTPIVYTDISVLAQTYDGNGISPAASTDVFEVKYVSGIFAPYSNGENIQNDVSVTNSSGDDPFSCPYYLNIFSNSSSAGIQQAIRFTHTWNENQTLHIKVKKDGVLIDDFDYTISSSQTEHGEYFSYLYNSYVKVLVMLLRARQWIDLNLSGLITVEIKAITG